MSDDQRVNLLYFTFDSLFFCETPPDRLAAKTFVTAVNKWYMPFIRTGWAVPFVFVLDVTTMLLWPKVPFKGRWKQAQTEERKQLALDYYHMLQSLRKQPIFMSLVALIESIEQESRRIEVTKTFLRFLIAEFAQFRETYAFDTRELKIIDARLSTRGIEKMTLRIRGKTTSAQMLLGDVNTVTRQNEFGTLHKLMRQITEYYSEHPLEEFISDEELLMIQVAAHSPWGISRVDYRFLQHLLLAENLSGVEEVEPDPRMVEMIVPTDSYEVDGSVGGYIDVNRRRFSGSLAEVLPAELSLFDHQTLMMQKLLNEGALHFVRENIECIEEELRVLCCFVVDVDERMFRTSANADPILGAGMTPFVRAKALAACMLKDLAQFMPREKVHVDFALYLWSSKAAHTYRTEIDVFGAWTPESAASSLEFASGLVPLAQPLFENRPTVESSRENEVLDRDPGKYIQRRSQTRAYHCRHFTMFSSSATASNVVPPEDPRLVHGDHTGDTIHLILCDVDRVTLSISNPATLNNVDDVLRAAQKGELSEDRLRWKFIQTVLAKAAGKSPRAAVEDVETLGNLE